MASITHYKVDRMKCQHCVKSVTTALEGLDGYQSSDIDLKAGTLALSGDIDSALVCSTLTEAGFPAQLSEA